MSASMHGRVPWPNLHLYMELQDSGEGAAEFLAQRTEALEACVDWLVSQSPVLLHRPVADLLLSHATRLR
jgi:predicted esterase